MQIKFGKMETKKELLDRVLLMMKYDSSKTLNENKKEIRVISEQSVPDKADKQTIGKCKMTPRDYKWFYPRTQKGADDLCNDLKKKYPSYYSNVQSVNNPNPNAEKENADYKTASNETIPTSADAPITMLNWLNNQAASKSKAYKYSQSQFNKVLELFLTKISKMTLKQLAEFQLSYKRSTTPGFLGAGKAQFADVLVDNEIYLRRMNGEEGYYVDDRAKATGQKPDIQQPEYTLLNGEIYTKVSNFMGKGAKQILSEIEQQRADAEQKRKEKKAIDSGCPFKNKTEGDAFRVWVNDNYPELAVKNDLDRDGDFCNSYIKKVANATFQEGKYINKKVKDAYIESTIEKKKREEFLNNPISPTDRGIRMYDDSGEFRYKLPTADQFKKMNDKINDEMKAYAAQNFDLSGLDDVLKRNDMTKFNVDITATADATRTKYDSPKQGKGWIEPKTKIFVPKYVLDQGKEAVMEYLKDVLDEKKKIEYENKISNSKLIKQLFKQEEIDYAFENCINDNIIAFFQGILDGKMKNKQGQLVGKWYKDEKGTPYMAKWDSTKIPCDTQFWMDYGLYIQVGGMIAVSLLTAGAGLTPALALLLELGADAALNLYSLKKSVDSQDEEAIKMDLAYVFLPFLMASAPVKSALKSAKFGDETIKSVETKLKGLPPNATKTQVDDLLKNMKPEEQRLISELKKEEYKGVVQQASKDVINGLKKTAKAPVIRKLSNPLINIIVYGAPAVAYLVKAVSDTYKQKTGKSLTQEENELWAKALAFLKQDSRTDLTTWVENASKEQLLEIQNSQQMKTALLKTQNPENLSREEINKKGQEILDLIAKLKETSKLDLKTEEDENQDLDFDEYDVAEWDELIKDSEQ